MSMYNQYEINGYIVNKEVYDLVIQLKRKNELLKDQLEKAERSKVEVKRSKVEGTAYPWWFIVCPANLNRFAKKEDLASSIAMSIVGPFFSRESADNHRRERLYDYGFDSIVWCGSAYYSKDYRAIYKEIDDLKEGDK